MTSAASAPTITTATLTQPPCVLTMAWGPALPPHQQRAWTSYWSSVFTRLLAVSATSYNDPIGPNPTSVSPGATSSAEPAEGVLLPLA
jgi:hypothetical protein